MKYHIWRTAPESWVVVRENRTVVRYCRTFEQARRSFIGDVIRRRREVTR